MYKKQTFVNALIQASVDANDRERLRITECKEKTAKERLDKIQFLTDVYFEVVNKRLMKAATEGTSMSASVCFFVEHFQVSKELEELGVFIGYPNEIANRWFNEMQNPESKFLPNPYLNWSGLSIEIEDRFEGINLKKPGKTEDGKPVFHIKFNWSRDMRHWSKYTGVSKVHKTDVREKEQFVFKIPQKMEPDTYTISSSNVSERFDNEETAAKEFDKALVAIGLKPVNFSDDESDSSSDDESDEEATEKDEDPTSLHFKVNEEGELILQAQPKPGATVDDLNGLTREEWDEMYKEACKNGVSVNTPATFKEFFFGLTNEKRKQFEKDCEKVKCLTICD